MNSDQVENSAPQGGKTRQTPIDIRSKEVFKYDGQLRIDYRALGGGSLKMVNSGRGWRIDIPDGLGQKCPITGGVFGKEQYRLLQLHAHWGPSNQHGSEHLLEGQAYAAELHLVHWNASRYSSFEEALINPDGLAVIGILLKSSNQQSSEMIGKISSFCSQILYKGQTIEINDSCFDLNNLIPNRTQPDYYFYPGSLTSPDFQESVLWVVWTSPLNVNDESLQVFRSMFKNEEGADDNIAADSLFRETQPINGRIVLHFASSKALSNKSRASKSKSKSTNSKKIKSKGLKSKKPILKSSKNKYLKTKSFEKQKSGKFKKTQKKAKRPRSKDKQNKK